MQQDSNNIIIKEITSFDTKILEAVNHLLPQLSSSTQTISREYLNELIMNPYVHLYMLYDIEQNISGMLTLCICASPIGVKAWIEDVVVDKDARGKGFARQLVNHARNEAVRFNAKAVLLTSRPERVIANKLYPSMGFERRNTNVYRWKNESKTTGKQE